MLLQIAEWWRQAADAPEQGTGLAGRGQRDLHPGRPPCDDDPVRRARSAAEEPCPASPGRNGPNGAQAGADRPTCGGSWTAIVEGEGDALSGS